MCISSLSYIAMRFFLLTCCKGTSIICRFFSQKLLEEIEKNKEKVDECQKYAKAYIDTIKVRDSIYIYLLFIYNLWLECYNLNCFPGL